MVITYFALQTRIKCSQWVAGAVYGSQDIPVGDPFHRIGLEVNNIGSCAWNKPGKVKVEALKGC